MMIPSEDLAVTHLELSRALRKLMQEVQADKGNPKDGAVIPTIFVSHFVMLDLIAVVDLQSCQPVFRSHHRQR
jgi:hypothetical protein